MDWNRHDEGPRAGEIDLTGLTRARMDRGAVKAVLGGVAALSLVLVAVAAAAPDPMTPETETAATPTTSAAPEPSYEPMSPTPAEWAELSAETDGEQVDVARVVDGDTFVTADGDRVRVLGIDSCEAGTPGGADATAAAESWLLGSTVTLTREPGVDRDRYDRALRYVQSDGTDFGTIMVTGDHTGVYGGRNDASPEYLADLRQADEVSGRDCSGRASTYVAPRFESDDDGESRFCRKRWYC